jgi:hypothetical protein
MPPHYSEQQEQATPDVLLLKNGVILLQTISFHVKLSEAF